MSMIENAPVENQSLGLAAGTPPDEAAPKKASRRERPRKSALKIENKDIAKRVIEFFDADTQARTNDIDARLQRYAKFRMWTEGKDWPWEDASDCAIPDLMTHSLKVQDTLHNAVMSTRPAVNSKALSKADTDKQENVDNLLDFQFFVENPGEIKVGEMSEVFVNDGYGVVFVPWVKDFREVHEMHTLPMIPDDKEPEAYFDSFLRGIYQNRIFRVASEDGWSWEVLDDDKKTWFDVEFYTVGDQIEMDALRRAKVFDAPCPIVKDYEDVLAPVRCANLQIPSPSNPGGAAHVILVDYPTIDEIKRLAASGFYDLPTEEEIDALDSQQRDTTIGQDEKQQKDTFQGAQEAIARPEHDGEGNTPTHKTLTRLMCFDLYDADGDGVNEDMIWWVLKEPGLLLRARELTQVFPMNPPRRPLAEGSFLPVKGRRGGISLLEQIEGIHDLIKQLFDQTVDRATLTGVPFFFYRASSNMRPETLRLWPGEGYPLSDPKNDVVFPQFPQGSSDSLNVISMLGQSEERLTNIGDLQLGRVPAGKSSALRTVRGMQSVLGQGDARPERILRRFMIWLVDVYSLMHELNQVFLPREKQIRVFGVSKRNEDPYRTIEDPAAIRGRFKFDFIANAMNTNKDALQQALEKTMQAFLNPLFLQMGIVKPEDAYQMARDFAKSLGQDPDKYLTPPSPDAGLPKLFAEEAMSMILAGNLPECRPAEPAMEHLSKMIDFANQDAFGLLTPPQVDAYKAYLGHLRVRMRAEAEQQALVAAAGQFQQGQPAGAMPGPEGSAPPSTGNPALSPNELLDESLPGAGGGGNPGMTVQ